MVNVVQSFEGSRGLQGETHVCEFLSKLLDQEHCGNDCGQVQHDHNPLHKHENTVSVGIKTKAAHSVSPQG